MIVFYQKFTTINFWILFFNQKIKKDVLPNSIKHIIFDYDKMDMTNNVEKIIKYIETTIIKCDRIKILTFTTKKIFANYLKKNYIIKSYNNKCYIPYDCFNTS